MYTQAVAGVLLVKAQHRWPGCTVNYAVVERRMAVKSRPALMCGVGGSNWRAVVLYTCVVLCCA